MTEQLIATNKITPNLVDDGNPFDFMEDNFAWFQYSVLKHGYGWNHFYIQLRFCYIRGAIRNLVVVLTNDQQQAVKRKKQDYDTHVYHGDDYDVHFHEFNYNPFFEIVTEEPVEWAVFDQLSKGKTVAYVGEDGLLSVKTPSDILQDFDLQEPSVLNDEIDEGLFQWSDWREMLARKENENHNEEKETC